MKLLDACRNWFVKEPQVQDGISRIKETEKEAEKITTTTSSIICNGKKININWPKVKTFLDNDGLRAPVASYKKANRLTPNLFVVHFDVCLSSAICFRVLKERGLSVHFLIDNDGTIYQTMDTKDIAWHAKGVNKESVGVEISNAFYKRFQESYIKMGLPPRPIVSDSMIHGRKIEEHLGFYPIQEEALKALILSLKEGINLTLSTPSIKTVDPAAEVGDFHGIVHHYHITENKIDSCGLDLTNLISKLT